MYLYGTCLVYICCSDYVGVWDKVCCVAAVKIVVASALEC